MTEFEYTGIDKWHKAGYTGSGVVVLNHEKSGDHAKMTREVLLSVAPGITLIEADVSFSISDKLDYLYFTIYGEKYTAEEMYALFQPDIMNVSFAGYKKELQAPIKALIDKGLVVFNAAGNEESPDGRYKDVAINVGAVCFRNGESTPSREWYSAVGDEVDFCAFCGDGRGTSAASPFLAGMAALMMERYGKMNQAQIYMLLDRCAVDLGAEGKDEYFGNGVVKMPDFTDDFKMFSDVAQSRWSYQAILWAAKKGLLKGYPDGRFYPEKSVSREELATVLYRMRGE